MDFIKPGVVLWLWLSRMRDYFDLNKRKQMSVTIEKLVGLQRDVIIKLDDAEIEKSYAKRLQTEAARANMKGFRKGKVPVKVMEQQSGKIIRQHVVGEMIEVAFDKAVREENLKVAGTVATTPLPEVLAAGQPVEVKVTVELYPEIDFKDLSGLKLTNPVAEVAQADIDKTIASLQKQHATWSEVDTASEDGDKVTIDFVGTLKGEKEPMPGGSAEGHVLELGSASMIPGFEDGVVGMKAGDEKELKLSFPKDYHAKDIAGKKVNFKISAKKVERAELIKLEDLPSKLGEKMTDMDAVTAEITKSLHLQLEQNQRDLLKLLVLEQLNVANPIDIPVALVDAEIKHLQREMLGRMTGKPVTDDSQDLNLPREPFLKEAESRVRNGLLLSEAISKLAIKPDADRLNDMIEKRAQAFEEPQMYIDYCKSDKQRMQQLQMGVLEDQVIDELVKSATVADKKYSVDDLAKDLNEKQPKSV
jgi:trigger factor